MLGVKVYINFTTLLNTSVVRIKGTTDPNSVNVYEMLDGRKFRHRYGDGAVKLAIKILRRTKEPER
jgi:hypothetical protein